MQAQNAVIYNQPQATTQLSVNTQETDNTDCGSSYCDGETADVWAIILTSILCFLGCPWVLPFTFVAWLLALCVSCCLKNLTNQY